MSEKKVVIWVDGCFDCFHFGHANALRQAKMLGDYLIVGVHSDEEIMRVKGPTVMNQEERYEAVRGCKWVDLVVEDAPYTTDLEMVLKYKVDWVVHGDDLCVDENGNDVYEKIKKVGKFKTVKRTIGVSTTDIVNRMLRLSYEIKENEENPFAKFRQHLPTCQKIRQFSSNREILEEDKVVYIDGVFDLFHIGHIEFLKKGKEFGTYLIVGVHDDQTAEKYRGKAPIMNIHERILSVLSCGVVDDVVIGSPYCVTQDLIDTLKISIVIHGSVQDEKQLIDPYELPKKLNIYQSITSPREYLTASLIVQRILDNYKIFKEKSEKKFKKDKNSI